MTQNDVCKDKTAEFKSLFLKLDEKGRETGLSVLRSLEFAQSVMGSEMERFKEPPVKGT